MGDNSVAANSMGSTGLGLAMAKQLVELHGGELSVTSTEGEGSCFTASFTAKPKAQDIPSSQAASKTKGQGGGRPAKPPVRRQPSRLRPQRPHRQSSSDTGSVTHNKANAGATTNVRSLSSSQRCSCLPSLCVPTNSSCDSTCQPLLVPPPPPKKKRKKKKL